MPDLALVLEMGHNLSLSRKSPHQAATIGSRVLLGRPDTDVCLVNMGSSLIHQPNHRPHIGVGHILILIVI